MAESASVIGNLRVNVDTSRMDAAVEACQRLVIAINEARAAMKALGCDLALVRVEEDGTETEVVSDAT